LRVGILYNEAAEKAAPHHERIYGPKTRMLLLGALTVFMLLALSTIAAYVRRDEIMGNWSKYRDNPLYMFSAPMFKPDNDPRSRLTFAMDNFVSVLNGVIIKIFGVFLQPILKIIQGLLESVTGQATGIMNMRGIFTNMFKKFTSVTDIFQARYNRTFHALRMTWTKLRESLDKTFAATIATLYAGVSTFRIIENSFKLMTIVSIAILSILLGIVIFFFFVLWPILPLIIIAIHFVAQTPYAGEVTGMQEAFCFAGETLLPTTRGPTPIKELKIGDILVHADGSHTTVSATMIFDGTYEPLYDLFGVQVSGAHIVFNAAGYPLNVKDHPHARPSVNVAPRQVYCLITSDNKIPVISNNGITTFADWEEISTDDDLAAWNRTIFGILNPDAEYVVPSAASIDSEAAISGQAQVQTPHGPVSISNLHPGATVYDEHGVPTLVTGFVQIGYPEVAAAAQLDTTTFVSAGAWVRSGKLFVQPQETVTPPTGTNWYMLFTEAGTFRLVTSDSAVHSVRDFSDVGVEDLKSTYAATLTALAAKLDTQK